MAWQTSWKIWYWSCEVCEFDKFKFRAVLLEMMVLRASDIDNGNWLSLWLKSSSKYRRSGSRYKLKWNMKFAGTEHTSQVIALLINNAVINVKTESGVGVGYGQRCSIWFASWIEPALLNPTCNFGSNSGAGGVLETWAISGWGCAAGILEPLTYTRASSTEFCYPLLE